MAVETELVMLPVGPDTVIGGSVGVGVGSAEAALPNCKQAVTANSNAVLSSPVHYRSSVITLGNKPLPAQCQSLHSSPSQWQCRRRRQRARSRPMLTPDHSMVEYQSR